ncbi:MAG: type II toxin-antitoxin system Phd/YefM family antitoxin [Angustibacter sp.]
MRTMSATRASRSFATLLREVERGESVVITRGGREVAMLGPVPVANGEAIAALLMERAVDDDFYADIMRAREIMQEQGSAWPEG